MQAVQLKKIYSTLPSAFANGYNQVYWDMHLEFLEPTQVTTINNETKIIVPAGLHLVKRFTWCPNVDQREATNMKPKGLWMCICSSEFGDFVTFIKFADQIVILERI